MATTIAANMRTQWQSAQRQHCVHLKCAGSQSRSTICSVYRNRADRAPDFFFYSIPTPVLISFSAIIWLFYSSISAYRAGRKIWAATGGCHLPRDVEQNQNTTHFLPIVVGVKIFIHFFFCYVHRMSTATRQYAMYEVGRTVLGMCEPETRTKSEADDEKWDRRRKKEKNEEWK